MYYEMAGGMTEESLSACSAGSGNKPLFMDVHADEELETTEVESLCMQCGKSGVTRLMLTKIPMFREVILMSFSCPHCNASNNEIQPGAPLQDKGVRYSLCVQQPQDINRQMVKSDTATFSIPELEFEVPANTQRGVISTVEGIIERAITALDQDQGVRKVTDPEVAAKIDNFISKLKDCMEVKSPFTVILDDPAGNSFVHNPYAPKNDPCLAMEQYTRSVEQDLQLGISQLALESDGQEKTISAKDNSIAPDEVLTIPSNCPSCNSPVDTRMKLIKEGGHTLHAAKKKLQSPSCYGDHRVVWDLTDITYIPYFKEVVVMSLHCEMCGHRSNEVKTGGGVSERGVRFTLTIASPMDLSRDVLKSENATVMLPELEFEAESGGLCGRFTTVEGLLDSIKTQLLQANPFSTGDSGQQVKFSEFIGKLTEIINGSWLNVHLILDDPAGNSYIQNPYAPDSDPCLVVENYVRTYEQNDSLGLNDMKTENYS